MLTYDQSRALDDPSLKKMVFGGFGAGKSIVGKSLNYWQYGELLYKTSFWNDEFSFDTISMSVTHCKCKTLH